MFFEQNQILNVLICSKCSKHLDEPRLLPCGNTVCNKCASLLISSRSKMFGCALCRGEHALPDKGFPLNMSLLKLIEQKPTNVYRGKVVENFKANLESINEDKIRLEQSLKNGADAIKKHCLHMMNDVQLSAEAATRKINELSDSMIEEIKKHEDECIAAYQKAQKLNFDPTIKQIDTFHKDWSLYLQRVKLDEEAIARADKFAVNLRERAAEDEITLENFIFGNNFIVFEKNSNPIDKNILGSIKSTSKKQAAFQSKKTINIKTKLTYALPDSVVISINENDAIHAIYLDNYYVDLSCITFDKNLNDIKDFLPEKHYMINIFNTDKFKVYKDSTLISDALGLIHILDSNFELKFSCHKAVRERFLFCMNEKNIFCLLLDQPKLLIQPRGANNIAVYNYYKPYQSAYPTMPAYFPKDIKQFECLNDKLLWLSNSKLQILNEKTGLVENSIEVDADKFIFDFQNNICLLNHTAQRLQVYSIAGVLLKELDVEEHLIDQPFFMDKQDKFIFFNKHTFDLHFQ